MMAGFMMGCALPAAAASAIGTLEGMVINVSDGDHITVINNGTGIHVELYGINAPIMVKTDRFRTPHPPIGQPYSGRAFMALANKVLHKQVKIEILHMDYHGRAVAIVRVDGRNINHEMVAEGWAWACQKYKIQNNDPTYHQLEQEARSRRLGLWAQDNPVPPWEFRKKIQAEEKRLSKAW